jgi:hypothetical protein
MRGFLDCEALDLTVARQTQADVGGTVIIGLESIYQLISDISLISRLE